MEATFSDDVTAADGVKLRLEVGHAFREATVVPSTGKATVLFRYRVQRGDRTDPANGIRVPANPFVERGVSRIQPTGGRTLSLLFPGQDLGSGHAIGPQPDRVWDMDAGEYTSIPVWSDPGFLTTGQEGTRYRLIDGMRHYYLHDSLTRRWMLDFRIAGADLSADDLDLIQWVYLRGTGRGDFRTHPYGGDAHPVAGKPWLGRWDDFAHQKNQICWGLEAPFTAGKTRGQRLSELQDVVLDEFSEAAFGRYQNTISTYVSGLLSHAKSGQPETCPEVPPERLNPPELQDSPEPEGAAITGIVMHSNGPYTTGAAIAVAVIFDREVEVSGAPQLAIEVGGSSRTAVYDAALSSPRAKVFRYTVRETDRGLRRGQRVLRQYHPANGRVHPGPPGRGRPAVPRRPPGARGAHGGSAGNDEYDGRPRRPRRAAGRHHRAGDARQRPLRRRRRRFRGGNLRLGRHRGGNAGAEH